MPEVLERGANANDLRDEVSELRDTDSVQGSSGGDQQEEIRQYFRRKCRSSLYFLAKAVLGYSDLRTHPHKELADFIQDLSNKRTLDLYPRGTYKTTIGTIAFSIWYLLNYPNHYILIANQTASKAERMLLEIESHLDGGNPIMNWLFPEFIKPSPRHKPWNSSEMMLPNTARTVRSGTPSIMTIGVGGKAESLHFHVIINDDLIGEKAMESETVMLDAIAWHDYSVSLFVSPRHGVERMHGTRWSMSDIYSVVLRDPEYESIVRPAKDPKTGELLFPELLDEETLRKIRDRNFAVYMSQYMNDPSNPEALDFNINWLQRYRLLNDPKRGPYCLADGEKHYVDEMDVILAIDPAGSGDVETNVAEAAKRGRAKKANNAIVIWGTHGTGKKFLLDVWTGRGHGENPEYEIAKKTLDLFVRWRGFVRRGYVESYGAQRALITVFDMVCRQHGQRFRLEEIGRENQKAKKVRIRTYLGTPAQNGDLYVRNVHDQFIHEFSQFPQSDTFDTLDATAWAMSKLTEPGTPVERAITQSRNAKIKARIRKFRRTL